MQSDSAQAPAPCPLPPEGEALPLAPSPMPPAVEALHQAPCPMPSAAGGDPSAEGDRSLISFCLFAYNQEKYIREAVEGALSQTYSPLEIILSDDCSTDKTYEIMEEVVRNYVGVHCIKLNKPRQNRGLVGQINDVVKIASGRFIVLAAGDDISLPDRTAKLYERWKRSGFSNCSIFSKLIRISDNGACLGDVCADPERTVTSWMKMSDKNPVLFGSYPGCTHAFTKDSFDVFGDLNENVLQEDIILQLRSSLIGGVGFVNEPLVKYRITTESVSRQGGVDVKLRIEKRIRYLESYLMVFEEIKSETMKALHGNFIDKQTCEWAINAIESWPYIDKIKTELMIFKKSGVCKKIAKLLKCKSLNIRERIKFFLFIFNPNLFGHNFRKFQRSNPNEVI